jgi:hypothetical protein
VGTATLSHDPEQGCWHMRDDEQIRPLEGHPHSEDVAPVFAIIGLFTIAIALTAFTVLGIFP